MPGSSWLLCNGGAPPRTPDHYVLDHRIIASNRLIAPLVTMSCRLLLRRVASRGVLPRERFSPLGWNGHRLMASGNPVRSPGLGCRGFAGQPQGFQSFAVLLKSLLRTLVLRH